MAVIDTPLAANRPSLPTAATVAAVAAAVLFLGESFTWVNGMGLLVLIAGVVLFNYLKYQKLKSDLHLGQPVAGVGGGGKASDGAELAAAAGGDGGCSSGSGSEVELSSGGGGGLVRQPSGGAEHQTLMLGIRQGFLVEEEQLLRQGSHGSAVPWRPETMRSRAPSPPGSLQTQRSV
jgi:solute carrier family 35 protein C2